jgi:hypothetical protein
MNRSDFDSVLQRIGLLFFLALYFLFTGLISLTMWQTDRLVYFQEHGAGERAQLESSRCSFVPFHLLIPPEGATNHTVSACLPLVLLLMFNHRPPCPLSNTRRRSAPAQLAVRDCHLPIRHYC